MLSHPEKIVNAPRQREDPEVVVAGLVGQVAVGIVGIPAASPPATAQRTCHNDAPSLAHAYTMLHKRVVLQLT
ncbi:MAG: hypothetical protein L3K26_00615 [Candidatus Hydrogenedentes bacterium]|nr:hypothetical protein [Candidatus Hydrogenedentota bacterium]